MFNQVPIGDMIQRANEIRLELERRELEFKEKMAKPKAYLAQLTNAIHARLQAENMQNAKGTDGSLAFRKKAVSVSVADWDVVWAHIVAHNAWHLLTHAVAKSEVQAMVEETGTPPPGVNYVATEVIEFRQPKRRNDAVE